MLPLVLPGAAALSALGFDQSRKTYAYVRCGFFSHLLGAALLTLQFLLFAVSYAAVALLMKLGSHCSVSSPIWPRLVLVSPAVSARAHTADSYFASEVCSRRTLQFRGSTGSVYCGLWSSLQSSCSLIVARYVFERLSIEICSSSSLPRSPGRCARVQWWLADLCRCRGHGHFQLVCQMPLR